MRWWQGNVIVKFLWLFLMKMGKYLLHIFILTWSLLIRIGSVRLVLEFCLAALIHCFCAAYRFIGQILNRQSEIIHYRSLSSSYSLSLSIYWTNFEQAESKTIKNKVHNGDRIVICYCRKLQLLDYYYLR